MEQILRMGGIVLELVPERVHVDARVATMSLMRGTPGFPHEGVRGDDLIGVAGQSRKQLELGRRKRDPAGATGELSAFEI